jgi:hypothetical protein
VMATITDQDLMTNVHRVLVRMTTSHFHSP